jgi:hypothetical protein
MGGRLVKKLLIRVLVIACSSYIFLPVPEAAFSQNPLTEQTSTSTHLPPAEAEKIIAGRAKEALLALRNKEMAKLSQMAHPQKGVRFSPYLSVNDSNSKDRVFTRRQLKNLYRSNRRYFWGYADGSGDPIRQTFRTYYKQYVWTYDFLKAKQVSYNVKSQRGTTLNSAFDFYPKAILVEYHHIDFESKYQGMDWQSLWLVFEKQGQTWYLVGILHDEWTI